MAEESRGSRPIILAGGDNGQVKDAEMHNDDYEAHGTERVDMRKRIIARMVSSPSYMAAIPLAVADCRAEGDDEGADELQRLAEEAQRQIDAKTNLPTHAVTGEVAKRSD